SRHASFMSWRAARSVIPSSTRRQNDRRSAGPKSISLRARTLWDPMLEQAVIAMIQSASSHSGSDNHARTMDVLTAGLQRRQTFDEARAARSCGTMAVPRRRGADGIAFPYGLARPPAGHTRVTDV